MLAQAVDGNGAGKKEEEIDVVDSYESSPAALVDKYREMADMRRDYEDVDIRDCIPTLEEMIKSDLMYELLEDAANGKTEKDVLDTAFYTEEPPTMELGYDKGRNVFIYKVNRYSVSKEDVYLNKIDGGAFRIPISSIIEPSDKKFTLSNGESYSSFKDYCIKKGLINEGVSSDKQLLHIKLIGVSVPEIPRYEIQIMKESDIVKMTLVEARKKGAHIRKYNYNESSGKVTDRTETGDLSFYKVKDSSGKISYHEIVDDDNGFIQDKKSGYKYNKIVVCDNSVKNDLAGGYKAKDNLIELLQAGNLYFMLDANGIKASKTTSKYKLHYNHWWSLPSVVGNMIDQWCEYTKETAITRLTYSPYGTDEKGKFVGAVYAPRKGLYANVGKYNLADSETHTAVDSSTKSPEMNNLGGNYSTAFELYRYNKNNQIWLDSFTEMTKESYRSRLEFHKDVTGIDFRKVRNCTMMIGDTFLLIPPQNIRSLSSIDYEKVSIMRGKGSLLKNNTNRDLYIEVDLYFYNGDGVNGIPKDVVLPNGETVTYHMNGLRSLIAQFKVAPYLPVENQFINDVLNVEAVSLVNLNITTAEGIPRLLKATLTLRDFNYRVYMPDLPIDFSSAQSSEIVEMNPIFAKCFNWDVFRFYYQRMISFGNHQKEFTYNTYEYNKELYSKKEILQPVYFCEKDGFPSSAISFYTPDENWLKNALTLEKDSSYYGQTARDIKLTDAGEEFFKKVGALAANLKVNSTYAQRVADHCKVNLQEVPVGKKSVTKENILYNNTTNKSIVQANGTSPTKVTPQSSTNVKIPSSDSELLKGYTKLDVSGGNTSGSRKPNSVVDIGFGKRQYWGFTNEHGQLFKVVARKVTLQDSKTEPVLSDGRYYEDEAKVPGVERADLDEGHVIADSLGGVSNAYNITPQNSTVNRKGGKQYQVEEEIRSAGGCTDFVAIITYPNNATQIPSHYSYSYTINGKRKTVDFANEEPGTKNFDKNSSLANLLIDVKDNINLSGVLKYNSVDESFDGNANTITWKVHFDIVKNISSDDLQLIKEKLKDLTGKSFSDVLANNKLTVTIKANTSATTIDPSMMITCPEISAMARYTTGVDPTSDVKEFYDYLNPAAMQFLPYLMNIELQGLSMSLTNNFGDINLKSMDGFAPQYMGSSDISIELSLITTDPLVVSMLNMLPAHAANIGKLYRRVLSCWPIKVRNHYLQMAGVNEVLIDLIEIQTVQDFPGTYEIRMKLTSVDRTMRQRETMKQLESDMKSTTKTTASIHSYWDLDAVLSSAELYPDLDLPSLKELSEYGFEFIRYRGSKQVYPDPDFYMSYAWPYTSYIIKKNLKDVFYDKIFHDEGKEKSEILDETSFKFFDEMGMVMYKKLDPITGLRDAEVDGKTQNELADTFDENASIINEGAGESIDKANRNSKKDAKETEEKDAANLTDLLIYLTACDVTQGWTLKPGFVAPVVLADLNMDVEELECSGIAHDTDDKAITQNAYAQEIFDLRAEAIKAIDDFLADPIDYNAYSVSLGLATEEKKETTVKDRKDKNKPKTQKTFTGSYGDVIAKVVDTFSKSVKGKKILQLLNTFETDFGIQPPPNTSKKQGIVQESIDIDFKEAYTSNFLTGFLYAAAKCISGEYNFDADTSEAVTEPKQFELESGMVKVDNTGAKIPNCKIERNGKPIDHADTLEEALNQGRQWGMFQIKLYKPAELKKMLKPASRVTYLPEKELPMYKDKNGNERWHAGFIDPYYNIAGYKSKIGKEYIEKIATNEGINTIAFLRVMLMHLRRMIIDGQIFSELDIVARDYDEITQTVLDAHIDTMDNWKGNWEKFKDVGTDIITAPLDIITGLLSHPIETFKTIGMEAYDNTINYFDDVNDNARMASLTDALGGDEESAGTIAELINSFPDGYKRSFCSRLILPTLMATIEGSNDFRDMLNNYNLNELNGLTMGAIITKNEPSSLIVKYCQAMLSIGMMDFSKTKTSPETTSDSQKLWNYIMKEAYTKLADDPQAYVLHSYYDMLINDKRGRLVRAFPTYYIVFIDEGRKIGSWKLFDNFYNMNAVSEITVSKSRKIAADTCSFVMSNVYSSYAAEYDNTTRQQFVDVYSLKDVFNSIFTPETYFAKEDAIRRRQELTDTVVLKPGVRIHVRMGYGSDGGTLPVVFNGKIAEIDVGDVVQVIAQGDGLELSTPLNALGEVDAVTLTEAQSWLPIFKDIRGSMQRGGESPRNLLAKLLTAQHGGPIKKAATYFTDGRWFGDNPFGIYHFGSNSFNHIFVEGESVQNLYEVCDANLLKGANELYSSKENSMATPTLNTTIQDKTFWDILQLCANSGIGYAGAVRDFGMRSTVCLCKPNQYYAFAYKKIDDENGETEGKIIERRKPFQQFHYYDSYTDIIHNSIKASEKNMKTNAVGIWESTDMVWGKSQATVGPIYLDINIYPEYQRSMTVDTTLVSDGVGGLELNFFTHFSENWASDANDNKVNKALARRVTTNVLRDSVSNMYCGELAILGDTSVKPHDRFYINDIYEDMMGHMEVEAVVFSMNSATGFTTTIYPDAIVRTADDNQEAARRFAHGPMVGSLAFSVLGRNLGINSLARIDSGLLKALGKGIATLTGTPLDELTAGVLGKFIGGKAVEAAGGTVIAGLTVANIVVIAVAAVCCYVTVNNVKSWLSDFLKDMNALSVYPILKDKRPLLAGMAGHKGSVMGYEYTKEDADDSFQGMILNSVEWLNDTLPGELGDALMGAFTRKVDDGNGNKISEYELIKRNWQRTLPLSESGLTEDELYNAEIEHQTEQLVQSLHNASTTEFANNYMGIPMVRNKYRVPNLTVQDNPKTSEKTITDKVHDRYFIGNVGSMYELSSNHKVLALSPIEDELEIKQAVIEGGHGVVKQLFISHAEGNAKLQMPFESGNRIIKFWTEQNGGGPYIYDLPMLQQDAVMILKLILNDQALKNKTVTFLSGTRVNDTKAWKSTGFSFVLNCNDTSALEDAIKNVAKQTTELNKEGKEIFEYKNGDEGIIIIVRADIEDIDLNQ